MKTIVVLINIRSDENVGSIFRTCDAVDVSKVYLVGYTPTPIDRFGRTNSKLIKASLGAEGNIEWEQIDSFKNASGKLKKENFKIVGVEQSEKSKNYKLLSKDHNIAFVFGNEVDGISTEDLELCDEIVDIPMKGKKESLNVAVSAGIILFSR